MAYVVTKGMRLCDALKAEGFPIPEMCREVRLVIGSDEAYVIQYDVVVTGEHLAGLGRALVRVAEDTE